MDPINYGGQFQGPLGGFLQGIPGGVQLGQNFLQMQMQREAAEAKAKAEQERLTQLNELIPKLNMKTGSAEDWVRYANLVSPEQYKAVSDAANKLDENQQKGLMLGFGETFSALNSGNKELGVNTLKSYADAYRNAGDEVASKRFDSIAKIAEIDPEQARKLIGGIIPALPGGKDLMQSILDQSKGPYDIENTEAQTDYYKAQAEKLRADIEADRNPAAKPLDTDAKKIINTAVDSVISSDLLASQAENLAVEFEKQRPPAGWIGNAVDFLKKAVGGQDKFTSLKQEYVKLRNTDVLKNLPPGVASDKDIEIALKAFPDENANPDQISSFLRGVSKLQKYSSSVNKAKADWVNNNGSLGPARIEFKAGGVPVKRGQNFWDITKSIEVPNVVGSSTAKPTPKVIEGDF